MRATMNVNVRETPDCRFITRIHRLSLTLSWTGVPAFAAIASIRSHSLSNDSPIAISACGPANAPTSLRRHVACRANLEKPTAAWQRAAAVVMGVDSHPPR